MISAAKTRLSASATSPVYAVTLSTGTSHTGAKSWELAIQVPTTMPTSQPARRPQRWNQRVYKAMITAGRV